MKRGVDARGKRRYKCRDCGRSFGGSVRKVFGMTKLFREVLMRYAECLTTASRSAKLPASATCLLEDLVLYAARPLEALHKHMPSLQVEVGASVSAFSTTVPSPKR